MKLYQPHPYLQSVSMDSLFKFGSLPEQYLLGMGKQSTPSNKVAKTEDKREFLHWHDNDIRALESIIPQKITELQGEIASFVEENYKNNPTDAANDQEMDAFQKRYNKITMAKDNIESQKGFAKIQYEQFGSFLSLAGNSKTSNRIAVGKNWMPYQRSFTDGRIKDPNDGNYYSTGFQSVNDRLNVLAEETFTSITDKINESRRTGSFGNITVDDINMFTLKPYSPDIDVQFNDAAYKKWEEVMGNAASKMLSSNPDLNSFFYDENGQIKPGANMSTSSFMSTTIKSNNYSQIKAAAETMFENFNEAEWNDLASRFFEDIEYKTENPKDPFIVRNQIGDYNVRALIKKLKQFDSQTGQPVNMEPGEVEALQIAIKEYAINSMMKRLPAWTNADLRYTTDKIINGGDLSPQDLQGISFDKAMYGDAETTWNAINSPEAEYFFPENRDRDGNYLQDEFGLFANMQKYTLKTGPTTGMLDYEEQYNMTDKNITKANDVLGMEAISYKLKTIFKFTDDTFIVQPLDKVTVVTKSLRQMPGGDSQYYYWMNEDKTTSRPWQVVMSLESFMNQETYYQTGADREGTISDLEEYIKDDDVVSKLKNDLLIPEYWSTTTGKVDPTSSASAFVPIGAQMQQNTYKETVKENEYTFKGSGDWKDNSYGITLSQENYDALMSSKDLSNIKLKFTDNKYRQTKFKDIFKGDDKAFVEQLEKADFSWEMFDWDGKTGRPENKITSDYDIDDTDGKYIMISLDVPTNVSSFYTHKGSDIADKNNAEASRLIMKTANDLKEAEAREADVEKVINSNTNNNRTSQSTDFSYFSPSIGKPMSTVNSSEFIDQIRFELKSIGNNMEKAKKLYKSIYIPPDSYGMKNDQFTIDALFKMQYPRGGYKD